MRTDDANPVDGSMASLAMKLNDQPQLQPKDRLRRSAAERTRMARLVRVLFTVLIGALVTGGVHHAAAQEPPAPTRGPTGSDVLKAYRLTQQAFRVAAKSIEPSLVTIESFGGSSTTAGRIGGIRQRGEGNTTGVVLESDGLIITSSFNFIDQPSTITVLTHDGTRHVARVLGRDDSRRICLLQIEGDVELPVPQFLSAADTRVGQWAISVGLGYGDSVPAISMGIVSAKNRAGGKAIQTDANTSPANYGGPLLDLEGRVIGICVPMAGEGTDLTSGVDWYDSGIGFAIPVGDLDEILGRMKRGVTIQRAFLGIQSENASGTEGVRITEIVPGSSAADSGLRSGDTILEIDGQPVPNVAELRGLLQQYYAGDKVTVAFQSEDTRREIEIVLGAPVQPEAEDTPPLFPGRRRR